MKKLSGVIPPMITPFTKEGDVDEQGLRRLVEYLSGKVDGLFICGSYGCGALMSLEERKRVACIVKETASAQTTIVVHTGTTNTRDTIELTLHAAQIGCDAASAVGPYYYKYASDAVYQYYADILDAVDGAIPFYAYHNPGFQGYETNLEVFRRLKDRGLAGIKDATFDVMKFAAYQRELVDDNFDVALGTEAIWVSAHALGCRAYIPGIGNVFPELCRRMWSLSMEGKAEEALALQFRINKLRDIMYLARSTQLAIYAIAELRGIVTAYPRAPFIPATQEEKQAIAKALEEAGLLS
ncbi:MAG: dihydrodipicolinate synthase family protein [Faecousia sp.]